MNPVAVYVAAIFVASAALATENTLPVGGVVALALIAPMLPVFVSYMVTRKKIQDIHVLVNSQMSTMVHDLVTALTANISLKDEAGIPVSDEERAKPQTLLLDKGEAARPKETP